LGLLSTGETPEKIHYYLMDAAGRGGPNTGALDVGSEAGTSVYAPVTGTVTSIRPDPVVQDANVIEIKPDANPDVRVNVSLVLSEGGAGVNERVTAGMTELGTVADSASGPRPPALLIHHRRRQPRHRLRFEGRLDRAAHRAPSATPRGVYHS
jgi:hypothetical protein